MKGGAQLEVRLTYAQRHALTALHESWQLAEDLRLKGVLLPTLAALVRKGEAEEGRAVVPGGRHLLYRLKP